MTPRHTPSARTDERCPKTFRRSAAGAAVLALVLGACGGDDSADEPSARELRAICRGGEALHQAAALGDLDAIDAAVDDLEAADAERLTDLDLDVVTQLADDGDLRAIEDAFDDIGCDDVGAAATTTTTTAPTTTTEPVVTQPPITPPPTNAPTTGPDTTGPDTTGPDTTEPDTTEPDTTEPAPPADPSGFVMIDFDADPLPPETAINPLLDGQPVDVLTSYGVDGVLVPASPNAQILELDALVSASLDGETRRRTDNITYIVDTDVDPDDLRSLFRAAVDEMAEYNYRESSSERDGITTISFDADVAQFDQTIPNWTVAVSHGGVTPYVLVSVRRQWGDAPIELDPVPAPVASVLGGSFESAEDAGWTRRGYSTRIGINIFNGQPSNFHTADFTTDVTDLDEASDQLLAALGDGAGTDDTTSTDTRAVVDADGGRWLFIQTGDNTVTVSYNAPR